MKPIFLFVLICITGSVVNKIFAQDNYSLTTVKMSFSYTKKIFSRGTSTLIITGNNDNAPMVKNPSGNIIVSTKNFSSGESSRQPNPIMQMPLGGALALNSPNYNKFFLQIDQDHSLKATMSYTYPGQQLKGVPDINFIFNYDPGNKLASIGIGGTSASVQTITKEGQTTIIDGTISGGVGATTDISKSLYGYDGMQKDPNTAYIQLSKTKTGYRISYTKETKENNGEHGETTGTTTEDLIAYIGEPDEIYEAEITPYHCDYEHWLPAGPTVDGKEDTRGDVALQFSIDIHKKGDASSKYPGKMNISWHLGNVTNYPGFCNNYPPYSNSPEITPDLIFNPDMKQNHAFTSVNNTDAIANKVFSGDAVAKVTCMDYAAWGKLSAVITLDNGTTINAASYTETGKQYLTIPLDKDENNLADAWEENNNKEKHPLTWDEDAEPSEQRENGDGYTLFEEYRGFAVHINADKEKQILEKEDFLRTDPDKKDAFVYDKDNLFKDYYFDSNPSGVQWHYLSADKKQLYYDDKDLTRPLNRWVNFNKTKDYFYSEQYALVISYSADIYDYDPLMTAVSFGPAEWRYARDYAKTKKSNPQLKEKYEAEDNDITKYNSPLKKIIKVEIIRPNIEKKCAFVKSKLGEDAYNKAVKTKIANSVRHEVGHCIGIQHHKPSSQSGYHNCVMRYFLNSERTDPGFLQLPFTGYCKKGQSGPDYGKGQRTGPTPEGEEDYTNVPLGTTSADNCYGQITVKSKPGE